MNVRYIVFILMLLGFVRIKADNVKYVDNRIGVIDKRGSNCIIGPQRPYGSISPSPQTFGGGNDGYSPDSLIMGFGQLHVSGTGWGKYGHFLLSPQIGVETVNAKHLSEKSDEIAKPYLYQVRLDRYDILTKISPEHNSAMYEFTFPESDSSSVVLDATQSITDFYPRIKYDFSSCKVAVSPEEKCIRAEIECSGGWVSGKYKMFFIAYFNKEFNGYGIWKDANLYSGKKTDIKTANDKRVGTFVSFKTKRNEKVVAKVAISFKSFDNAEKFLSQELPHWNINKVMKDGVTEWNRKLSVIDIESDNEDRKKIFYTAMYHTMIQPRDRTGDNPKWTGKYPYWDDNYAIWDTWRTCYPLLLLIDPQMVRDNINSFIDRLNYNGGVYDGFVAGNDMTNEQGGNDVDNVIADAYIKGLDGIDWREAYKVVKHNADNERKGGGHPDRIFKCHDNGFYKKNGWIPYGNISSSYTLEYNYNDYCVAMMAKGLGYEDDYRMYMKRSEGWKNLWDSVTVNRGYKGFVGSKLADGNFVRFAYDKHPRTWSTPFYEANSWTYSLLIPHDIKTMIILMGGNKTFVERLEYAFNNALIAYWNEPAFLAIRLFSEAGRPDLCSYWTHRIMREKYDLTGYPENDDTGGMSSWYVFSSMGFFPNAGLDIYYLNAPMYEKIKLRLENGKTLNIKSKNHTKDAKYIKSCRINGKEWNKPYIRHKDISEGGNIEFELSETPTKWGMNGNIIY